MVLWQWSTASDYVRMAGAYVSRAQKTYEDRFGNEWVIRVMSKCGQNTRVCFTCGEFKLIANEDEASDGTDLNSAQVKELFCDAERVVMYGKDKWYVGYRKRTARGGRAHGGVYTRFRSEAGEVRYFKGMLHFRHMPHATLSEHLTAARPAASPPAPIKKNGG